VSCLDYGTFQPIQIASIIALNEGDPYIDEVRNTYESRRNALVNGLNHAGWHVDPPAGTMFAWAKIPEPFSAMGSKAFDVGVP
jgi:alanine-synthesizing transaminase